MPPSYTACVEGTFAPKSEAMTGREVRAKYRGKFFNGSVTGTRTRKGVKLWKVEFEDNLLTVRTKHVNKSEDSDVDGEIIHKGISQRQFARSFTIADDVKVNGAELKDGLLTISCERIIPEHKKKKLIEIK